MNRTTRSFLLALPMYLLAGWALVASWPEPSVLSALLLCTGVLVNIAAPVLHDFDKPHTWRQGRTMKKAGFAWRGRRQFVRHAYDGLITHTVTRTPHGWTAEAVDYAHDGFRAPTHWGADIYFADPVAAYVHAEVENWGGVK